MIGPEGSMNGLIVNSGRFVVLLTNLMLRTPGGLTPRVMFLVQLLHTVLSDMGVYLGRRQV